jgi:hypothetical protein
MKKFLWTLNLNVNYFIDTNPIKSLMLMLIPFICAIVMGVSKVELISPIIFLLWFLLNTSVLLIRNFSVTQKIRWYDEKDSFVEEFFFGKWLKCGNSFRYIEKLESYSFNVHCYNLNYNLVGLCPTKTKPYYDVYNTNLFAWSWFNARFATKEEIEKHRLMELLKLKEGKR